MSTHVHATEDEAKVVKALLNLLPTQMRSNAYLIAEDNMGHFGNRIRILKLIFKGEDSLNVLKHILTQLNPLDREILMLSLSERFNEGRLYLRFNKQLAYRGILRLDDSDDVIKAVVRINHWVLKRSGIETIIRDLMSEKPRA